MKKLCIGLMFLFVVFSGNQALAAGVLIGAGNLGVQSLSVSEEVSGLKEEALLYGATGKYFFGEKPTLGFGITYNYAKHEDGKVVAEGFGQISNQASGEFEWEITTLSVDVMYNFTDSYDFLGYLIGSLGSIDVDASFSGNLAGNTVAEFDDNASGGFWSVGIGGCSATKGSFSLGGELKYIGADLNGFTSEIDGIVQAYVMLGYAF